MKKAKLTGVCIALMLSTTALAETGALKASDEELEVLSAEASHTIMKEETPETPVADEPAVAPSATTNVEALSESVAKQLTGILGAPDAGDEKKTEAKLEGMVSSALLEGANMDDLRSAVSAAMEDIAVSEQEGVTAEKVKKAERSLKKLVGKADDDYVKQQQREAEAFASSLKSGASVSDKKGVVESTSQDADTVIVQPGESLYKIALRIYGSGDNFVRLYEANKDRIVDPNLIRVGQVLRVPH